MDRPGFSLCAAPLESSGPDFEVCGRGQVNKRKSGGILDQSLLEGTLESEGRSQDRQLSRGWGS